jgi:hypothetical protein
LTLRLFEDSPRFGRRRDPFELVGCGSERDGEVAKLMNIETDPDLMAGNDHDQVTTGCDAEGARHSWIKHWRLLPSRQ